MVLLLGPKAKKAEASRCGIVAAARIAAVDRAAIHKLMMLVLLPLLLVLVLVCRQRFVHRC